MNYLDFVSRVLAVFVKVHSVFYKNLFYNSFEADKPKFQKRMKNIPQAESRLRTFLYCQSVYQITRIK